METLSLVKPNIDLKDEYLSCYQEWKDSKENMVPWVISKDPENFEEMLQFLRSNEQGIGLPENWVPDCTYWLVNESDSVLGVVNIRHRLTEFLLNCGGHIGYGIRPTERRKGYATKLLELSLDKARELGIDEVLVVRDTDFVEDDGNVVHRFWIRNFTLVNNFFRKKVML